MTIVLFLIHIPYEKSSKVNEEILRKRRDNENIDAFASLHSLKAGEEETTTNDIVTDCVDAVSEESEEKSDCGATVGDKPNGGGKVHNNEETNPFFPENKLIENLKKESIKSNKLYNRFISYDRTEAFYSVLQTNGIKRASWEFTEDGENWQVMFPVESQLADKLLNELLESGIGNNTYSSISILPITVNFPAMLDTKGKKDEDTNDGAESPKKNNSPEKNKFIQSVKSRLTVAQVIDVVRQGSQLTFDHIMFVVMASTIAGVGLVENSSVLLVASMLVSPLMGPILGGTFGIVIQYTSLWKTGIRNEIIDLALCVVVGFVFGLICGFCIPGADTVTPEMESRTAGRSLIIGVIVAVPSGAGVALSILGGNTGSLVGVAISASLLPPAVNAGMLWAFAIISGVTDPIVGNGTATAKHLSTYEPVQLATMGLFSLVLTLINIAIVVFMGVIILKVKEVAPNTGTAVTRSFWKKDLKTTREYLKGHTMGFNNKMADSVISEWGKLHQVDFDNKDTIKGEKGARLAIELKRNLEKLEVEETYSGVRQRLAGRIQPHSLKRLVTILDTEEKSRFSVSRAFNVSHTTFHPSSRFMINKLDEENNTSLTGSTFDLSNVQGTDNINTKLAVAIQSSAAQSQSQSLLLNMVNENSEHTSV